MVKLIACVIVIDRLQTAMPSRAVVDSMTRVEVRLENLTRSGRTYVPGSGAWRTNGLDGSDGSDFTL